MVKDDRLFTTRVALFGRVGEVGVTHERADPDAAVRGLFDPVERKVVDVDDHLWPLDVQLHQVEQRGAAGDEADPGAVLGRAGLSAGGFLPPAIDSAGHA